jgi:hypothetical protein
VLAIEEFNPLLRVQALRLLGRAKAELGEGTAACEAAERAVAEAARARYAWLQMLALADLLGWCDASEGEAVRARLCSVAGQMVASKEELVGVLGEGVL